MPMRFARLGSEEARRSDDLLELARLRCGEVSWFREAGEELGRGRVDPLVGALRRQDGRSKQLEGAGVLESAELLRSSRGTRTRGAGRPRGLDLSAVLGRPTAQASGAVPSVDGRAELPLGALSRRASTEALLALCDLRWPASSSREALTAQARRAILHGTTGPLHLLAEVGTPGRRATPRHGRALGILELELLGDEVEGGLAGAGLRPGRRARRAPRDLAPRPSGGEPRRPRCRLRRHAAILHRLSRTPARPRPPAPCPRGSNCAASTTSETPRPGSGSTPGPSPRTLIRAA